MLTDIRSILEAMLVVGAVATAGTVAGCSSDSGAEAGCPGKEAGCPGKEAGCPGKEAGCPASGTITTDGDAQTPPTGDAAAITAWLQRGDYKAWACEPAKQAARGSSPHGENRVCSNTLLSASTAAEYPVGAAGVKEIFENGSATPTGYAIYRKMESGKGGAGWYWIAVSGTEVEVNSLGTSGVAKDVCVGCHDKAPKDQVFVQVK
jgi:hypothetical protein